MPRTVRLHRGAADLGVQLSPEPTPLNAAACASRDFAGRVLAATLRTVGDLDIAEESTADAFVLALQTWPHSGVPTSVEAWLITAARNRALDRVRRAKTGRLALLKHSGGWSNEVAGPEQIADAALVGDDELRMVVLCCDPRLAQADSVALTLRLACGVPTEAIAAGFGVPTTTMAARLTRAKAKLVKSGPRLDLPDDRTVDERLPAVAMVVYLAFTLGHTTASGPDLVDDDLQDRAQYLAAVLRRLRPDNTEFAALLALILLTRARAGGRIDDFGAQVLLADADRSRWNAQQVKEGVRLAQQALTGRGGPLAYHAAVAAEHARAPSWSSTNWTAIVALYSALLAQHPSHTVAVGRCIAVGQLCGPAAGLTDLDEVMSLGGLTHYPYAFAGRAFLLEQLDRRPAAAADWTRAAGVARTDAERHYFGRRAAEAAGRAPVD